MEMNSNNFNNKQRRKIGRTLVVKSSDYNNETLQGLVNSVESNNGSRFLVFDTTDNAKTAFHQLRNSNVVSKPSYYNVFFKIRDTTGKTYDDVKQSVKTHLLTMKSDMNVLYFKLKVRDNVLTGSGEMTLDRKEDMDLLLEKHNFTTSDGYEITVYRYISPNRRNQYRDNQMDGQNDNNHRDNNHRDNTYRDNRNRQSNRGSNMVYKRRDTQSNQ